MCKLMHRLALVEDETCEGTCVEAVNGIMLKLLAYSFLTDMLVWYCWAYLNIQYSFFWL